MNRRWWALAALGLVVVVVGCGDTAVRRGDEALARQDFKTAIEAFSSALDQNPDDVSLRYRLVEAHVKRINVARSLGPLPLPELEQAVAEVHEIIEPVKDQEADLRQALVQLHYSLARNYDESNMPERARDEWRVIADLQPTANAHYNFANASMLLGDWEGAIAAFQRALEMDEFLADAHKGTGNAYIQLRQDADAVTAYRKALDIEPLDTSTRYNLGIALKRTGHLDEAVTEFEAAIEQDATYPLPYRGMRDALEQKGDVEGALEWDRRFREVAGIDNYEGAAPTGDAAPGTAEAPQSSEAETASATETAEVETS